MGSVARRFTSLYLTITSLESTTSPKLTAGGLHLSARMKLRSIINHRLLPALGLMACRLGFIIQIHRNSCTKSAWMTIVISMERWSYWPFGQSVSWNGSMGPTRLKNSFPAFHWSGSWADVCREEMGPRHVPVNYSGGCKLLMNNSMNNISIFDIAIDR